MLTFIFFSNIFVKLAGAGNISFLVSLDRGQCVEFKHTTHDQCVWYIKIEAAVGLIFLLNDNFDGISGEKLFDLGYVWYI